MRSSVLLGILVATLTVLASIYYSPPTDDFEPGNPFWNGLSTASEDLNLTELGDLASLRYYDPRTSALLIVGPSEPFSQEEVGAIADFLSGGGLVIVADEFGTANELLDTLGVGVRLNGSLLLDPLFRERSARLPKIFDAAGLQANGSQAVAMNFATVIEGSAGDVLARSSAFSFLDLDADGEWDEGEPRGPFVVAAETRYGGGRIVLISDSSVLINAMVRLGGNLEFVRGLSENRTILLDTSHWTPSRFTRARALLIQASQYLLAPEFRYSVLMLTLAYLSRARLPTLYRSVEARESVEEALKAHPEWDRDVLERLAKDLAR